MHGRRGAPASLSLSRYQGGLSVPLTCLMRGLPAMTRCFRSSPAPAATCRGEPLRGPVEVQITGSILTYDIRDPLAGKGEAVKPLSAQFPDLRRFHPGGLCSLCLPRASACPMWCRSSASTVAPRARRLACREAYPVAERFLEERLPHRRRPALAATKRSSVRRRRAAAEKSSDFSYPPERRHHRQQQLSQTGRSALT